MSRKSLEMAKNTSHVAVVTAIAALVALAFASQAVAAAPAQLSQFCEKGSSAGQCANDATGLAADPNDGDVYVADKNNKRIDEFTIWGQFIRAFGGGVVNGGATGVGSVSPGFKTITAASTTTKAFVPGMLIEGTGIAPGTTVVQVTASTIVLSEPPTSAATNAPTQLSSPEAPNNVPLNEVQEAFVTATGGTYKLQFMGPLPGGVKQTTSSIHYNASASEVQQALEGLSGIGAGNVSVTSTSPGSYRVEFSGALADTDVRVLGVVESSPALSGGDAEVAPVRQGASSPEVCTGLECREGVEEQGHGQFEGLKGVAVDSQGDLYTYESGFTRGSLPGQTCGEVGPSSCSGEGSNRVQKFSPSGEFLLMFGGDINKGGGTPSNPGNVCTAGDIANGDQCARGNRGGGPGEFGLGGYFNELDPPGSYIAVGPGDSIYVGGNERIQRFSSSGIYQDSISLPSRVVSALAVDRVGGALYAAFFEQSEDHPPIAEDVSKLNPAGEVIGTLEVPYPQALAVDEDGKVFVSQAESTNNNFPLTRAEILEFDSGGKLLQSFGLGQFPEKAALQGLATTSACGITGVDLFVANGNPVAEEDAIHAYGSPPNPSICPPPSVAPTILSQFATSATSTDATVKAEINPHFWPGATYYVEYGLGPCSEGGCTSTQPAPPGALLTNATVGSAVTTPGIFLQGLESNTKYHYRFVATSEGGGPTIGAESTFETVSPPTVGTSCPNQAFRTSFSAVLPDCRAYEMVSPVDKNGGDVGSGFIVGSYGMLSETSSDGDRATFSSLRSFADPSSAPLVNQYFARREAGGWSTESISPPRETPSLSGISNNGRYRSFSEDLCSGWVMQDAETPLVEGAPAEYPNLYRRDNCAERGNYELLTSVSPPGIGKPTSGGESNYIPNVLGASADASHSVFRADAKLTENACSTSEIFQVYESSPGGKLRLVSVLPNGKATCTQSTVGTLPELGVLEGFRENSVSHAVSADGSRVFWTDTGKSKKLSEGGGERWPTGPGALYVRVNALQPPSKTAAGKCTEAAKACTQLISEAKTAHFWAADPDGHKALYSVGEGSESELFEYGVDTGESHLIAKNVAGAPIASEDLSRVYFVSTEVLNEPAAAGSVGTPHAEEPNLYFEENGTPTYIGTLGREEGFSGVHVFGPSFPNASQPNIRTSRVSPDGLSFAFTSAQSLTGYDNTDVSSGKADTEAFVFHATPGSGPGTLACVSCNPSGARPVGRDVATVQNGTVHLWASAEIPGWAEQQHPTRLLSDDGSELFFESFDALVPRDNNGKEDVYEWRRADSKEACEEQGAELFDEDAEGCISLISSGQSPVDSELIDASADGSDVFFVTGSSLLPQDPGLIDIYDARVNGGFPAAPTPSPACEGEACQGALNPPNDPTPASSSFEGAGNVKPEAKAHKHKKKSKHKKKAKKKQAAKKRANNKRRAGR